MAWVVWRRARGRIATRATILAAAIALGGTMFSIYLTYLEPFVLGATCMWCLTSALTIVVLFWMTVAAGWAALQRL